MGEHDALFFFLDGLQGRANIELKRGRVQDLTKVIVAAKSLMEFKRKSSKG